MRQAAEGNNLQRLANSFSVSISSTSEEVIRILAKMSRTPKEILDQTNRLARDFYATRGYLAPEGHEFHTATHPQEKQAWTMACIAQYELTGTDLDDVLAELTESEADSFDLRSHEQAVLQEVRSWEGA